MCGFSVGIMWPGTISISSKKFPTGGTALFALLAMAGDLGGSIGTGISTYLIINAFYPFQNASYETDKVS